jgi:site-specific DNA-methyltransferase (adenine-specific)
VLKSRYQSPRNATLPAISKDALNDLLPETNVTVDAGEKAGQLEWAFDNQTNDKRAQVPSRTAPKKTTPVPRRELPPNLPVNQILCGDNLELIRELPNDSVNLVITSPPYFQQRDYGAGGMGNENELTEYLETLKTLFAECVRVITPDGSIVFNLGDKYADSSLLLVPYRFAIAVTEAFPVRLVNAITWVKQNPTPRQFRRRLISSTEPFFHFVKTDNYYYDIDAFLAADNETAKPKNGNANIGKRYFDLIETSSLTPEQKRKARADLTEAILEVQRGEIAGLRMKIKGIHAEAFGGQEGGRKIQMDKQGYTIIRLLGNKMKRDVIETPVETVKGCPHPAIYPVGIVQEFLRLLTRPGDVVLDPFMGSGSTAVACLEFGRHYIGYEISPQYCAFARQRLSNTCTEKRETEY